MVNRGLAGTPAGGQDKRLTRAAAEAAKPQTHPKTVPPAPVRKPAAAAPAQPKQQQQAKAKAKPAAAAPARAGKAGAKAGGAGQAGGRARRRLLDAVEREGGEVVRRGDTVYVVLDEALLEL